MGKCRMDEKKIRFEGIIDVGPIVISHTKNPIQDEALEFMRDVLTLKIRCLMPVSVFLGAYLVMVKYLRVDRNSASTALIRTLSLNLPIFYEDIPKSVAIESLKIASSLGISSWDAYLAQLAKSLGIKIIYTLNPRDFENIPWLEPRLSVSKESLMKYHEWVKLRSKVK